MTEMRNIENMSIEEKKRGRPVKHDPELSNYQKHKEYFERYNKTYQKYRYWKKKNKAKV